jgi:hypothetical protein
MYEVLKRGRLHNLSMQCQLDIFDKTVKPILLYGCETWGFHFENLLYTIVCMIMMKFLTEFLK